MLDVVTEVLGACRTSVPSGAHIIKHVKPDAGEPNDAPSNVGQFSFVVHSTWSQRDLVRMEKRTTLKSFMLNTASDKLSSFHLGIGADVTDE